MARSIEQVGQDLNQLTTASAELGRELTAAYRSYFATLAPTLKQQSIQTCYYLCTTCYPEAFLKLNYDRRSQLLKTLQRVIGNVITNLAVHIEPSGQNSDREDESTGELTSMPVMPIDWFATPASLSTWQQNIEAETNHSLKEISYKVNLLLQQAQIVPSNIPKPILEASPEADRQGESTANIPNLLSILVEQEIDEPRSAGELATMLERDDLPQIVQIQSLYLRLAEVEFSNGTVLSLRKNINRLVDRINALRREYTQKQQELVIAEAESAWRSSWVES
jgi:hypothetical protein